MAKLTKLAAGVTPRPVFHSTLASGPDAESPQHSGVGKQSITFIAQNRAVHDATHVAARCNLSRGDLNLVAVAIGVGDGGSVDDPVKPRPERRAHAHGARFAGGVQGVPREGELLKPPGSEPDGTNFGVSTGIALLLHRVQSAKKNVA